MRILLTNPPWYDWKENKWHGIRGGCRWPFIWNKPKPPPDAPGAYNTFPIFMEQCASFLCLWVGIEEVFSYDALARGHDYQTFYSQIAEAKPDIVLIETCTPSIDNDLAVAETIKRLNGCEIALAGPHATVFAEDLVKLPYVDYVLKGEYEVGSWEMCLMRRKGIYKCRPIENINTIPFPIRTKETAYLYGDGFGNLSCFKDSGFIFPQLTIMTSRGCPYYCTFCLWNHTMTPTYRQRSVKSVLRELTGNMATFGFKSVLFDDDTFNAGDHRTIEMSKAFGNIDMQWHALCRVDSCSRKAFMIMRQNGCHGIKLGVETFAQRGLDAIGKGGDAHKNYETVDFLLSIGFKVYLSLMDNIPGETEEDRQLTKSRLKTLKDKYGDRMDYQHPDMMALPGCKAHEGIPYKKDWKEYGIY